MVDRVDKGYAVKEELAHGLVAVILGDLLAQPFPESFNRVEIGTIAGQRYNVKAQFSAAVRTI